MVVVLVIGGGMALWDHFTAPDQPESTNKSTPATTVEPRRGSDSRTTTTVTSEPQGLDVKRAIPVAKPVPPLVPFLSEPVEAAPMQLSYSVVGVARGDTLNVRNGPSAKHGITAKLPNGYTKIRIVGAPVMNDTTEWVKISFGAQSGWVGKQYLEAE